MKTPYEVAVETRVGDREVVRFRTADGVHNKRSLRPAELALAETVWEATPETAVVVDANYGVVGTLAALQTRETPSPSRTTESRPASRTRVTMTCASARAGRLARVNAASTGVEARVAVTADPTRLPRRFEAAAYAPKPYTPTAMGKRRVLDALRALEPNGALFLAARDDAGCARYESCLETVGAEPVELRQRGSVRLLRASRPAEIDHRVVRPTRRSVSVAGETIRLVTVPGVFAAPGLDDGTRLLLERVVADRESGGTSGAGSAHVIGDDERVLDACCGAGPVAATVGRATRASVWATDDDPVAVACARRTLDASGVSATVRLGDCVASVASQSFDRVVCNPPTHAGSDVLRELFRGIERLLASDGVCSLVHHRSLAFDEWLAPFDSVWEGAGDETYRVRHCA
ncbi:MAG: methyltransferase [Halobaculum sp.]